MLLLYGCFVNHVEVLSSLSFLVPHVGLLIVIWTHREPIKRDRDWVDNQACRLWHVIYVIPNFKNGLIFFFFEIINKIRCIGIISFAKLFSKLNRRYYDLI